MITIEIKSDVKKRMEKDRKRDEGRRGFVPEFYTPKPKEMWRTNG